jgi:hypothetical protein
MMHDQSSSSVVRHSIYFLLLYSSLCHSDAYCSAECHLVLLFCRVSLCCVYHYVLRFAECHSGKCCSPECHSGKFNSAKYCSAMCCSTCIVLPR